MCVRCHYLHAYPKRVSDPITDGCEPLSGGWWELNSGPLEKQSVLLTAEPSLQPHAFRFYYKYKGFVNFIWELMT